jgi:DNA-binding MarR family transcriptional regulator
VTEQPFTPGIAVDINAAANAARAQLNAMLDRAGISFSHWIALVTIWNNTIANSDPNASRTDLLRTLEAALAGVNPGAARAVLAELESAALVRNTGEASPGVQLTPDGEATFRSIRDAIARLTAYELTGITDTELETTRRVLRLIAERAQSYAA